MDQGRELSNKNIRARVDLAEGLPPVVGHRVQLQEVVSNVVQNAIDALESIEDGHRTLIVRTKNEAADGKILLELEDSGPGVGPDQSQNIFDAFVTTKPHGMGLGLAICQTIVERHGGTISALAANPRGSIYHIVLPTRQPDTGLT